MKVQKLLDLLDKVDAVVNAVKDRIAKAKAGPAEAEKAIDEIIKTAKENERKDKEEVRPITKTVASQIKTLLRTYQTEAERAERAILLGKTVIGRDGLIHETGNLQEEVKSEREKSVKAAQTPSAPPAKTPPATP